MKKIPDTFTLVFFLLVGAAALTWIVPGGEYLRETQDVNGVPQTVVVADSYHPVAGQPQTWQILSAFFQGFVDKADIIIFILIVGGAFWMLNQSRAIAVGIAAFLRWTQRLERYKRLRAVDINSVILSLIVILFSLFGAIFGMSEETIAFTVIFVPLAISMGYDSITGVGICYMAAHVGFAGAMTNPFTVGVAQGMAGLPLFSGLEYRLVCWVLLTLVFLMIILHYANRVKKSPQRSPVYKIDEYWRARMNAVGQDAPVDYHTPRAAWITGVVLTGIMAVAAVHSPTTTIAVGALRFSAPVLPVLAGLFGLTAFVALRKSVHFFILDLLVFTVLYLIVGVLGYGWYVMEIAALFLAMGLFACMANGLKAGVTTKLFLEGARDILNPALVVGLASGIIVLLQDGKVIDTILYGVSQAMTGIGETASVAVMYVFQTALNLVMPSGSAKAALTMPLLSPFSDLIHVSRQTTVLAFQFGDGFTNMITPVSGVLLGCLGIARIPYAVWLRWVFKYILLFVALGFVLLLPTLVWSFNGF
ncbi:MAG: YfcC family protein [Prevotellaceae bacterium]|jgi:uncharacterized ion transporter superfamily protein YfcC|nr:YfcC family protein [Prevotellaceae bacterium]